MKVILVAGLIIASAGFASAGAQVNRAPGSGPYFFSPNTTPVSLQFERAERQPKGALLHNVTFTVGDWVVTADDALLIGENGSREFQLGANARVRLQAK